MYYVFISNQLKDCFKNLNLNVLSFFNNYTLYSFELFLNIYFVYANLFFKLFLINTKSKNIKSTKIINLISKL